MPIPAPDSLCLWNTHSLDIMRWYVCLFVCLCVCVLCVVLCMYTCLCDLQAHVYRLVLELKVDINCLPQLPSNFIYWDRISHWILSSPIQLGPRDPLSPVPSTDTTGRLSYPPRFLYELWESELQSSHLSSKCIIHWAIPSFQCSFKPWTINLTVVLFTHRLWKNQTQFLKVH